MDSTCSDSIKVCIRVRPPDSYNVIDNNSINSGFEISSEGVASNKYCLDVATPTSIVLHSKPESKTFTFDYVADQSVTQEDIFSAVGRPIIDGCMNGYNGTLFAYGQTGSGKTFTMIGPCNDDSGLNHDMRGVIPRGFEYLFHLINREKLKYGDMVEFLCKCSFLEIYNEQVYDLLDNASSGLHLRENMKRGVYVDGLIDQVVSTAAEAYEVLNRGWMNRRVAATSMNRESSRSHAVFMLSVESKKQESVSAVCKIRSSTLNLVDLAGSERQRDANTIGIRLKEAGSINKSLSVLGNVIMSLVDIAGGKSRHVHYRDSKLTFLLRDSLGGNSKTNLVANVHPLSRCFGETLSTLQFARRAKLIKNKAIINEDTTGDVSQLQIEIRKLKDTINNLRGGISVEPMNPLPLTTEGPNNVTITTLMNLRSKTENENKILREKVDKLLELCRKKDKSLQTTKLILKLRDSHISNLEKQYKGNNHHHENNTDTDNNSSVIKMLKEEIKYLQQLINHHPDVTRYAIENRSLKVDIEKLEEVCHHHGYDILTKEMTSLKQYTLQLENQIQANEITDKPHPSSSTIKQLVDVNSELKELQERYQRLQSDHNTLKKELLHERDEHQIMTSSLETKLLATTKAMSEYERNIEALKIRHRIERDSLNDSHMKSVKLLATPSSIRQCQSATSTPLQPLHPIKLRQKLFFQPLIDNVVVSNNDNSDIGLIDEGQGKEEETELEVADKMGVANECMWSELLTIQENNAELKCKLDSRDCIIAQLKSKEILLTSQTGSHVKQIQELRETLIQNDAQLSTCIETNQAAVLKLQQEETVLREEIRDLKLCLQSADKELAETKKEFKTYKLEGDTKISNLLAMIEPLEQNCTSKANAYERVVEDINNLQDNVNRLTEEQKFKDYQLQEKQDELTKLNSVLISVQFDNESLNENLVMEREKVSHLVNQLSDDTVAIELATSLEESTKLQREKNELQEKLYNSERIIITTQSSIQSLTNQLTDTQLTISELRYTVGQLRMEETAIMANLELYKTDNEDKEMKLTECLNEIDSMKVEIVNLKEAHKRQQLVHLKESRAWELQQEINDSQIEELQDDAGKLYEVSLSFEKLKTQLDNLESEKTNLAKQLSSKDTEIKQLNDMIEKVKDMSMSDCFEPERQYHEQIFKLEEEKSTYSNMVIELQDLLEEKETAISEYKTSLRDYSSLQSSFDLLKTQTMTQQYRIEADQEDNSQKCLQLETELTALNGELNESRAICNLMALERDRACNIATEVQERVQSMESDITHLHKQLERVKQQEESVYKEREELRSLLEAVLEAKAKLTKENEAIVKENAQLSGHRNMRQRIQFHAKLKIDHHKLLEEHRELVEKYQSQTEYINEHKSVQSLMNPIVKGNIITPSIIEETALQSFKENMKP